MKSQIAYYLITSLAPVGCARTSWFRMSSCTPPIYSYTGCPAYWAGSSNKLYYTTDDPVSLRYIKLIPKGLVHAHRANNIGQCQVPNPNNYIKCGTTWNVTSNLQSHAGRDWCINQTARMPKWRLIHIEMRFDGSRWSFVLKFRCHHQRPDLVSGFVFRRMRHRRNQFKAGDV